MFGFQAAPEAKYWHRLWSVQLLILGAAFTGLSSIVPMIFGANAFAVNHPYWFCIIVAGLNIGAIAGRLVDQPRIPDL